MILYKDLENHITDLCSQEDIALGDIRYATKLPYEMEIRYVHSMVGSMGIPVDEPTLRKLYAFGGKFIDTGQKGIYINTRVPMDEIVYSAAIHEIGHLVHPEGYPTFQFAHESALGIEDDLTFEVAAWEWAIKETLLWTPKMYQGMRFGVASHILTHKEELPVLRRNVQLLHRMANLEKNGQQYFGEVEKAEINVPSDMLGNIKGRRR